MAVSALSIYLVWASLAFGLRAWVQWRRTGDAGFRGGPPWVRALFVGAALAGVAGPVAELAGLDAIGVLDRPTVRGAGLAVALCGVAATVAAQWSMGASWRVGVDERESTYLVTTGAFALARNPIFTAMGVTAAGLAAMTPNPFSVAGLVLMITMVQLQVRVIEEPYLRRVHGAAYARYSARVGRFLPGVGRLAPGA
ncbi:isoprenylcysteine carboxylmethyltransferase family protein [Spirillospora sp. NPDC047279]|uniref:methyltransferase family protein n=1 Tax=Spirillospora sp. NPDC047279 TaxID=3155478 RepID=UPI0033D40623